MLYTNIMNFSIHIDDETARALNRLAKETGKKRNSLIREAIFQYLQTKRGCRWPKEVLELIGSAKDLPPFEGHRKGLLPPIKDPFE